MLSSVSGSTTALQGQVQRAQLDLNDWVTCVSAKTPKGQAEIQKYSGEISSAKEQIARIQASKGSAPSPPQSDAAATGNSGHLIDVWA